MAHNKQTSDYFLLNNLVLLFPAEIFPVCHTNSVQNLPQFQGAQILGSLLVYLEIIQQFSYTTEIYWLGSLEWFINILYKTDEAVISDAGDLDVQRLNMMLTGKAGMGRDVGYF